MLFLLLGLVGTRVTVTARSGGRYEGILSATAVGGDLSVVLKFVATSTEPEAPLKPSLTISGRDIVTIGAIDVDLDARTSALPPINPLNAVSGPADSFRTDTDISGVGGAANEGRTLQQWTGSAAPLPSDNALEDGKGATWDQFAVNERLYGVKTDYDDDLYTTKLDRSGKDYADRERRAAKVASEILSSAPTNAHVAEERNLATGRAEGLSEEDRYGAVVRGPNAYVPPGARLAIPAVKQSAPPTVGGPGSVPAIVTTADDGTPPIGSTINGSQSASASPLPSRASPLTKSEAGPSSGGASMPSVVADFRSFVTNEKGRLQARKQDYIKHEKDTRFSELVRFSKDFKVKYSMPADLLPLLSKDEDKQKALASQTAEPTTRLSSDALALHNATAGGSVPRSAAPSSSQATPVKKATLTIAEIPPFDPARYRAALAAKDGRPPATVKSPSPAPSASATPPVASTSRINPSAPAFRPNPNASSFLPGAAAPTTAPIKEATPTAPTNPFFGSRLPRKSTSSFQVKEDFSPFLRDRRPPEPRTIRAQRSGRHADAIAPTWSFTGKPYRALVLSSPLAPAPSDAGPLPSHSELEAHAAALSAHAQQLGYPIAAMMHPGPHHLGAPTSPRAMQADLAGMRSSGPPTQLPPGYPYAAFPYNAAAAQQYRYAAQFPGQPVPYPQHFFAMPPGAIPYGLPPAAYQLQQGPKQPYGNRRQSGSREQGM